MYDGGVPCVRAEMIEPRSQRSPEPPISVKAGIEKLLKKI
jgi:hypothetical protein